VTEPDPTDEKVKPTPLLVVLGLLAIVIGICAGLIMSHATLLH
jgi:hypothetical protein